MYTNEYGRLIRCSGSGGNGDTNPHGEQVIAWNAVINPDISDGDLIIITLDNTAVCTINVPSNLSPGQRFIYHLIQDNVGTCTVLWHADYRFPTMLPVPILSDIPDSSDYIGFVFNSITNTCDCIGQVFGF